MDDEHNHDFDEDFFSYRLVQSDSNYKLLDMDGNEVNDNGLLAAMEKEGLLDDVADEVIIDISENLSKVSDNKTNRACPPHYYYKDGSWGLTSHWHKVTDSNTGETHQLACDRTLVFWKCALCGKKAATIVHSAT